MEALNFGGPELPHTLRPLTAGPVVQGGTGI
jgi:hypothetical protein